MAVTILAAGVTVAVGAVVTARVVGALLVRIEGQPVRLHRLSVIIPTLEATSDIMSIQNRPTVHSIDRPALVSTRPFQGLP